MRKGSRCILAALALMAGSTIFGAAALGDASSRALEQKMIREQADNELYTQMQRVASWLDQYCVWNQRFPMPEAGDANDELPWAQTQLNQLVPNNPYISGKLQTFAGLDADPQYVDAENSPTSYLDSPKESASGSLGSDSAANLKRIQLVYNPSLNQNILDEYLTDPPMDWTAAPGTITAVSNNTNLIVVWGAGADGKPIRELGSNRTRLIVGHYKLEYGQSSY
ncbi:MAG TPA: hypothetical protein V6D17_25115 [Candidatus Obscuribacterales bacterium]